MRNHSSSPPSRSHSRSLLDDISFGEDIDLSVGLTSAAFSLNELYEAATDRRHRASHLLKAGLASAVSASAFTMMRREDQDHHHDRGRSRSRSPSRGHHHDHEHFHSPHLRSRSNPNFEQGTKSHPGNKLPYPGNVETQRGYSSDGESDVFGNGRHSKLPQMPSKYRPVTEKALVKSWTKHHGSDSHKSPSDNSGARHRRERDDRYHRSASPSPPRHRNADPG